MCSNLYPLFGVVGVHKMGIEWPVFHGSAFAEVAHVGSQSGRRVIGQQAKTTPQTV